MQRRVITLICAIVLGGAAWAGAQDDFASPKLRIEWAEFKTLYDDKKVVTVDVRDLEAFEASRIPGSINVPLEQVAARVAELKKHGKPIVFYCA